MQSSSREILHGMQPLKWVHYQFASDLRHSGVMVTVHETCREAAGSDSGGVGGATHKQEDGIFAMQFAKSHSTVAKCGH